MGSRLPSTVSGDCDRHWIRADQVATTTWEPSAETPRQAHWDIFPQWHEDAKCRTSKDPDGVFFGETNDTTRTSLTIVKIREVKAYCKTCPVFDKCLTHSLVTPERHGIWAGTSKRTRLRILALIDAGQVTIPQVVDDYLNGRERQYESIRKHRA